MSTPSTPVLNVVPATAQEVDTYLDQDGLMGRQPNPPVQSEGNPWLETATMLIIRQIRNDTTHEDKRRYAESERLCSEGAHGLINKNRGRPDEITHDEIKGYIAGGRAVGYDTALRVLGVALSRGWVLSNTGGLYYTAIVRPWDRAAYYLAAGQACPLYELIALWGWMLYKALTDSHAGSARLTWVLYNAFKGRNLVCDLLIHLWARRVRKKWKTLAHLLAAYYETSDRVLVRYALPLGDKLWPEK